MFEINFHVTCCRLRRGATVAFSVDAAAAEGAADGNANAAGAPLRATTENGVPGDDGVPSPYPSSASQPLIMMSSEASPPSALAVASANKMSE